MGKTQWTKVGDWFVSLLCLLKLQYLVQSLRSKNIDCWRLLLPKLFPSGGGRVETRSRPPARWANNWSQHKLSCQYRVSEPIVRPLSALPLLVFKSFSFVAHFSWLLYDPVDRNLNVSAIKSVPIKNLQMLNLSRKYVLILIKVQLAKMRDFSREEEWRYNSFAPHRKCTKSRKLMSFVKCICNYFHKIVCPSKISSWMEMDINGSLQR